MSSRAMKKLLRDAGPKDLELEGNATKRDNPHSDQEDDNDDQEDYTPSRPPARNLFALLDDDDEQDNGDSDEEEEEEKAAAPVKTASSASKKKKKKKSKAAASTNPFDALQDTDTTETPSKSSISPSQPSEPSTATTSSAKNKKKKKGKAVVKSMEEMSVEEFERSLQQMTNQLGTVTAGEATISRPAQTPLKQLLAVDTRFLDADAEMKKMFGARVVNSEIKDRRYAKVAKKALLAQPRGTWPVRKASGLSMEIVDGVDKDGNENVTTFKIVHSEYYQKTQLRFLSAVASYDPNNLVALLRESPFHIDCLLQLSEVSKHNGDNGLAGEFIEQALYAFEKSFHSLFNITSGSVRLSFMEVENRSFFLAIHRHIQFLGRRGCWRTAFEFNKLLLSLDPTHDELGSLLSIDFYALKAEEYTYLLKLYDRLKEEHQLQKLPNFAYSIALAQFQLEQKDGNNEGSNSNQHEKSSKMLQRAILMFPTAVPLLADQGSFSADSEMAGEPAFYPAKDLPEVMDLYIHLFTSRNFALWKEPEVISWLKANVATCVKTRFHDAKDPDVVEAKALMTELTTAPSKETAELSYSADGTLESDARLSTVVDPREVTLRVCRHVLVSDFNALARYLPQEIVQATMHMHDPLPPAGSRNVYEERFETQRNSRGMMGGARDAAQGVLEEVVRRMLRAGGVAPAGQGGAGGALQPAQLNQITQALNMLRARMGPEDMPGAFPGQDAAAVAGGDGDHADGTEVAAAEEVPDVPTATRNIHSLLDAMRRFGFGETAAPVATGGAEVDNSEQAAAAAIANAGAMQAPDLELLAALTNNFRTLAAEETGHSGDEDGDDYDEEDEYYDDEAEAEEEFDDETLAAMMAGAGDGWEPYDPAAYE
ncbi:Transcription factor 25 [Gryganskiella cystojenkinii]|nr:Transcription factor 25 [Gryganskiella cystojenkinii]